MPQYTSKDDGEKMEKGSKMRATAIRFSFLLLLSFSVRTQAREFDVLVFFHCVLALFYFTLEQ